MSDDTEQHESKNETHESDRAVAKGQQQSGSWVTSLAWTPDGTLLATGSTDGDARIIDTDSGVVRQRLQLDGPVCALAWSPDGTLLAVACTDGDARIIDAGSGEVRHQLQRGRTAGDEAPRSGLEHGDAQLKDLQDNIDKVRSQTGQEGEKQEERQIADEGESEVAPPG